MALIDGLVAYWKLDEASGTRNDSHGTNHLTDNNTVTQAAGAILGNAAQFTAANSEYLSIADNVPLSMGDIDFTLACHVYFDSFGVQRMFMCKGDTGVNKEYELGYRVGLNRLYVGVSNDGTAQVTRAADVLGAPSTATWYYVIAWHDSVANTLNIQVNNGTANSVAHTTGVFNGTVGFNLGAINAGSFHNGRMDEAAVWKRVLTTQERTDLYRSGAGFPYPFIAAQALPAHAAASVGHGQLGLASGLSVFANIVALGSD